MFTVVYLCMRVSVQAEDVETGLAPRLESTPLLSIPLGLFLMLLVLFGTHIIPLIHRRLQQRLRLRLQEALMSFRSQSSRMQTATLVLQSPLCHRHSAPIGTEVGAQ